jgi:hypothetical protein
MEFDMKVWPVRRWLKILIPLECMLFLSGCNKIIDWGKTNFAQTKRYSQEFAKVAQTYLRSTFVYSQFTMAATFDAIFLTDQMRMLYVDYHKHFHGLTAEQEATMRQRLLNENKYFISFYVIGFQKEHLYDSGKALFTGVYQKYTDFLGSKDSNWNISMMVEDKQYFPESVRAVDLPMEYRNCFGIKLNQFNTTYLVRFAVQDPANRPIFEPFKKYNVALRITSPIFESDAMVWKSIVYTKNA